MTLRLATTRLRGRNVRRGTHAPLSAEAPLWYEDRVTIPESGQAIFDFLLTRRSAPALVEPGPSREDLAKILSAAASAPDHGGLRPYRFVVAEGQGRELFGDALAKAAAELRPTMPAAGLEKIRAKAFRSPTVVAVVASPKGTKIERWEQVATCASAGYAIVLAAQALGVGAVWKSLPFTKAKALDDALGLSPEEEMLGWIHLGTTEGEAGPRAPLDFAAHVSVLEGEGRRGF